MSVGHVWHELANKEDIKTRMIVPNADVLTDSPERTVSSWRLQKTVGAGHRSIHVQVDNHNLYLSVSLKLGISLLEKGDEIENSEGGYLSECQFPGLHIVAQSRLQSQSLMASPFVETFCWILLPVVVMYGLLPCSTVWRRNNTAGKPATNHHVPRIPFAHWKRLLPGLPAVQLAHKGLCCVCLGKKSGCHTERHIGSVQMTLFQAWASPPQFCLCGFWPWDAIVSSRVSVGRHHVATMPCTYSVSSEEKWSEKIHPEKDWPFQKCKK